MEGQYRRKGFLSQSGGGFGEVQVAKDHAKLWPEISIQAGEIRGGSHGDHGPTPLGTQVLGCLECKVASSAHSPEGHAGGVHLQGVQGFECSQHVIQLRWPATIDSQPIRG